MNASQTSPQSVGLGALLVLAISLGMPASAYAGPGPEYWRQSNKPKPAQPVPVVKPLCPLGAPCPDSKVITISEARPTWPNARGPLQIVDVGTKRICYTCAGTTTVVKPDWSNGRGPIRAAAVAAQHTCEESGAKPPRA